MRAATFGVIAALLSAVALAAAAESAAAVHGTSRAAEEHERALSISARGGVAGCFVQFCAPSGVSHSVSVSP